MNALRIPLYACAALAPRRRLGDRDGGRGPRPPRRPGRARLGRARSTSRPTKRACPTSTRRSTCSRPSASTIPTRCARTSPTGARSTRWRTLNLENEHLKVVVLPDLGGHLYSCVDKSNGADMFYANGSIKKARVAYRGAWTALGIEFNFPVSHNWVTVSPVDYALQRNPDGSASVWVGNQDRVYGMQWRVALTLRPGQARAGAGRRPLQPQRHASPLLLVEQRRACASGTTAASNTPCASRLRTASARSTPGP